MEKLEVLLNRLMGWGWEPRGRKKTLHITIYDCDLNVYLDGGFMNEDKKSFRELVSKESGLWQFVCENGMIRNEKLTHNWVSQVEWGLDVDCKRKTTPKDYEYRLIESSLRDESELEDFLLSNIKL